MRLFKTREKNGKIKIKKFMALILAGTMITGSVSYASTVIIPNLYYNLNNKQLWANTYTTQQGFCTDNEGNYYLARTTHNSNESLESVRILKLDKNKKQKWIMDGDDIPNKYNQHFKAGHANDMTYCSRDGYIYMCNKGGNNASDYVITLFDKNGNCHPDQFYRSSEFTSYFNGETFDFEPSGIAYDDHYDVFYLTQKRNEKLVVSVFGLNYGNANPKNKNNCVELTLSHGYENQGITYKNGVLYVSLWDKAGKNNSLVVPYKINKKGNKFTFTKDSKNIMRFDQDKNTKTKFEIEGISFVGTRLYMAVNADKKAGDDKGDAMYWY